MLTKLLLVIMLIISHAEAVEDTSSPFRDPALSYLDYKERALGEMYSVNKLASETALSEVQAYSSSLEQDLPDARTWLSSSLTERFRKIRDTRFLIWKKNPDFPRRLSWLYPQDGCYARAAVAVKFARKKLIPVPHKVFVFGDLKVKTKNSTKGYVTWWYHVAPIVEVKNVKYVIDPSIEPSRPLKLKDWLSRMGDPLKMEVSICKSGAYVPTSECDRISDGKETTASNTLDQYLDKEWTNLEKLKRKPTKELGPNPSWISSNNSR